MQTEMLHGAVKLRALLLDWLVPMTVDAQVRDGVVKLTGTVGSQRERQDATYLAGWVPGVFGIMDELACRHRPDADGEAIKEAVAAALARSAIADVADLAVDAPCSGTVVLSGAVHSRSGHDLAIRDSLVGARR